MELDYERRAQRATVLDIHDTPARSLKDGRLEHGGPSPQHDDIFFEQPAKATLKVLPLSAKDKILALKDEVEMLESSLTQLTSHWRGANFPPPVLYHACEAAREKSLSRQSEALNKELRAQLLLQQLYLATLQRVFTESPLGEQLECVKLFRAMHQELVLKDVEARLRIT